MSFPHLELDSGRPCFYQSLGQYKVVIYEGPISDGCVEYDFVCVVQEIISRRIIMIITGEDSALGCGSFLSYFDEHTRYLSCKELTTFIRLDSFITAALELVQEQFAVRRAGQQVSPGGVAQTGRATAVDAHHHSKGHGGKLAAGLLAVALAGAFIWAGPLTNRITVGRCVAARTADGLIADAKIELVWAECAGASAERLRAAQSQKDEAVAGSGSDGSVAETVRATSPEVSLVSLSRMSEPPISDTDERN